MTRTGRKLLAAAALSTGLAASAGIAAANPTPASIPARSVATRAANPPAGCELRLWDASTRTTYWHTGNGKTMPDGQAYCRRIQSQIDVLAAAPKTGAGVVRGVGQAEWKRHLDRVLRVGALAAGPTGSK